MALAIEQKAHAEELAVLRDALAAARGRSETVAEGHARTLATSRSDLAAAEARHRAEVGALRAELEALAKAYDKAAADADLVAAERAGFARLVAETDAEVTNAPLDGGRRAIAWAVPHPYFFQFNLPGTCL